MLPIYKQEVLDGLKEKLSTRACLAYYSPLLTEEAFPVNERVIAHSKNFSSAENKGQVDLFYFKSILVSTGWNLNEDVFDRKEVWAARHTPEDKPFNYEHEATDIIGHHTANFVVADTEDLQLIDDDTPLDELPDKFHIVTRAVIYKLLDSPEYQERIEKIIAEIPQGKWYVSMEAWFRDFDYALIAKDGSDSKVVARNEKTAFLTKHLRAYGGKGIFEKYKVGRLLRNITFSGAGLVKTPANPESIIFKNSAKIQNFLPSTQEVVYSTVTKPTEKKMADINIDELISKLTERDNKISELQKQVNETNVKANLTKIDELTKQVEVANKAVAEHLASLETVKADLAKVQAEKEALATKLAETETKCTEVTKALDAVQAEKRKNERLAQVVDAYKVTPEVAEQVVAQLAGLDDTSFAKHIEFQKSLKPAEKPEPLEKELDKATPQPAVAGTVTTPTPEEDKAQKQASLLKSIAATVYNINE